MANTLQKVPSVATNSLVIEPSVANRLVVHSARRSIMHAGQSYWNCNSGVGYVNQRCYLFSKSKNSEC